MEETERRFWSEFVYARVLDGFCQILEDEAKLNKRPGLELATNPGRALRRAQRKRVLDAMRNITGTFSAYLKLKPGERSLQKLILKTRAPASSYTTYEDDIIDRLAKFLPEVHAEELYIWPGPLSIGQTVSLFVRTCVRTHCERQDLEAKAIVRQVAFCVIAPAVAYLAYLSSQKTEREYPHAAIKEMADGASIPRTNQPRNVDELRWFVLLSGISNAMNTYDGVTFNVDEHCKFFSEVLFLLEEHAKNPHGGRLWQSLGMLSSTSPASADTLLFQILRQFNLSDQEADKKPMVTESRIVCANIRYEVVRNAVYDEALRQKVAAGLGNVTRTVGDELSQPFKDKQAALRQLQLAFLISRRALLPSSYKQGVDISEEVAFAALAERLLSHNCNSDDIDISKIARRYRAGLITNPRFAKDATLLGKMDDAIKQYTDVTPLKTLLSRLFEGRRAWMLLLAGKRRKESDVHSYYAEAAQELFQSQDNYGADKAVTNNMRRSIDSEAPVWLLPELATLIRLGPKANSATEYDTSFADPRRTRSNEDKRLDAAATSLLRIGERQFGVYLNHRSEDLRVKQGMLLASKLL